MRQWSTWVMLVAMAVALGRTHAAEPVQPEGYWQLEAMASEEATEAVRETLIAATGDGSALIRLQALRLLAAHAPEALEAPVIAGFRDTSPWIRLQAAMIATDRPRDSYRAPCRTALAAETNETLQQAFRLALAAAGDGPAPELPAAARAWPADRMMAWSTHPSAPNAGASPFSGYVNIYEGAVDGNRSAHEAGKLVFGRALWGRLPNPAEFVLDDADLDVFWTNSESFLSAKNLAYTDGLDIRIVTEPYRSWSKGWPIFCREAGIDPERIAGDRANLTTSERRAFRHWEMERRIDGFNLLHDLCKLRARIVRPGLMIGTYYPAYYLPWDTTLMGVRRLRFDVGFALQYGNHESQVGYTIARMYKTLWPDRPVVMKAVGLGEESFTMRRLYDAHVPQPEPVQPGHERSYSNALLAWIAGAHIALTETWYLLPPEYRPQGGEFRRLPYEFRYHLSDMGPDTTAIREGIARVYVPQEKPKMANGDDLMGGGGGLDDLTLEEPDAKTPAMLAKDAALLTELRLAQAHVHTVARLVASLPMRKPSPDVLVVQPGYGVRTQLELNPLPEMAAKALVTSFDFLPDLNLIAGMDLTRYRVIIVHDTLLLQEPTIKALTQWLQETPGLLVIHRDLSAAPDAEASTVADHDGAIAGDWPWEAAMAFTRPDVDAPVGEVVYTSASGDSIASICTSGAGHVQALTDATQILATDTDGAIVAYWHDPAFGKGGVLYDGVSGSSLAYHRFLAGEIARIADTGIGKALSANPLGMEMTDAQFSVAVSPWGQEAAKAPIQIAGVDALFGTRDPVAGPGNLSALTITGTYIAGHLAARPGIVAVSETAYTVARADGETLVLQSKGLLQIAASGAVEVLHEDGTPLASIPYSAVWYLDGPVDGVSRQQTTGGRQLTYVRSSVPVVVRLRP